MSLNNTQMDPEVQRIMLQAKLEENVSVLKKPYT
jgi:hypothetical protein